jgi:hypothetical protein
MNKEKWFNKFGVAGEGSHGKYREEFVELSVNIREFLREIEPRVSPRDLHDIAAQAASVAASSLICDRVNNVATKRKKKSK